MPTFEVTIAGKAYEVDAPNAQAAAQAAAQVARGGKPAETASQRKAREDAQMRAEGRFASGKQPQSLTSLVSGEREQHNGPDRAIMGGLSLWFDDEMTATKDAANTFMRNRLGNPQGYTAKEAYNATLEAERGELARYSQDHPVESFAYSMAGGAPWAMIPGTAPIKGASLASNTARVGATGGALGGVSGAGAGTDAESRGKGALAGFGIGLAASAAMQGAGGALTRRAQARRAAPPSPQRQLAAEGVQLTPGQMAGGLAKNAEDLAMRAPILGPAIAGARKRGVESLSTAQGNRALREIGAEVPSNIKPGNETVEYVSTRLGQQYDDAAALVPSAPIDNQFQQSLTAIRSNASELGDDTRAQFDNIIKNRIESRIANGTLDGPAIRQMQKEIGGLAAKFGSSSDAGQQLLGDHLDDVAVALGDLLGRNSPEAAELVRSANAGWRNFVVMRNAAARNIEDGVPTPGQLGMAVKATDKSVGKGATAMKNATMQDLASNAKAVMPDQFGNPGTANAVGLGGLGATALYDPTLALGIGGGLGGASLLYSRPVIEAVNAVYRASKPGEASAALGRLAEMARTEPALIPVYEDLARQFGEQAPPYDRAPEQPISLEGQ